MRGEENVRPLGQDPLAAILLIWFPFLWVYSAINYWTECIDHSGLLDSEDDLEACRNFIVPKQIRMILFPRNDCYHLIHHLFPKVPTHHFESCHKQLLSNPDYKARTEGSPARDSKSQAAGADREMVEAVSGLAK